MTINPKDRIMQRAADTGKSVHLSASAGSGKTRALKDRYLALIDLLDRRGLNIDQAVAITFTDKAAAEIKERVMHDLPEAMLKKIIRGSQDLRISTIHSFCMNLLKRYPLEAGLLPDFGILDSRDQAYKIQKAIEDALNESDRHAEIMTPLNSFTLNELIGIIEFLISIRSRLKRMEIDSEGPDGFIQSIAHGMKIQDAEVEICKLLSDEEWRSSFERMEKLLKLGGSSYADGLGNEHLKLSKMQNPASAFKVAGALFPLYYTLDGMFRKSPKINSRSFTAKDTRQEFNTLFFSIQGLLDRLKNTYARIRSGIEAISLIKLYLRAEELYREAKLREGLLDFDDLEIFAYRLLKGSDSPDILYWLDRKILHFLVDEFQDTSDIQWAILKKLTEEIFSGTGADKSMPPTLFVVGDEKQSIYRFREANYRLIHTVREKMEAYVLPASRETLTLDKNFRSTPEVIEAVNRVFSGLWSDQYIPAEVERKKHHGSAQLIELLPGTATDSGSQPTEAEILAAEIKFMIQNRTMVYERSSDSDHLRRTKKRDKVPIQPDLFSSVGERWHERPAEYGDCAILIQSRTKLKAYEAALQAQAIPYRVVGGIGFYDEEEIQALINILFFLWNRDDDLALAAALKSPLFSLTDSDILCLRQISMNLADSLSSIKPEIGKMLETWRGLAKLVPLSTLVHRIIADTGAYVLFGKHNPQAIFNIDKLLDTAREFDRRGYTMLQDFVEWVKQFRQTEQREATSDMNLPGFHGSVSILTVHKAKGLEYPIVLLPGMNQPVRSLTMGPEVLVNEQHGTRRIAVRRSGNLVYEELWRGEQGEQEELRREHQRLLYVAMTRARDHLIMLSTLANGRNPVKPNTWLDFLQQSLRITRENNGNAGNMVHYSYPDWKAQPWAREISQQFISGQQDEEEVNLDTIAQNIAPLPVSEAPAWKSVTDFIEKQHGAEFAFLSPRIEAGGVSPVDRGSVLHRCLEEFTRRGTYDLDRILKQFPAILSLDHAERQSFDENVRLVLKTVLEASAYAWIFTRREHSYSELPFLYTRGRSFISGIIDRVVIQQDIGFVIDYKAILINTDEDLASWIELYRPQIQIYTEAVKHLFDLKSVEGYLLFLDSNRLQLVVKI